MNLVSLAERVEEAGVQELLAAAVGYPSPERLARVSARYREAGWRLLGLERGGRLVGLIGLEVQPPDRAVVQHIAVVPQERGRGIGRALLSQAAAALAVRHLTAETDADAVGFYRRCGFAVASLGEVYPGVERFRCTLAL